MLKLFLCLFLIGSLAAKEGNRELIPSSSLAGTSGLLHTLVNDSVSVITGEYLDSEVDLVLPGPEPLILKRFYSSDDNSAGYLYDAWHLNHPASFRLDKERQPGHDLLFTAVLGEPSGANLSYRQQLRKLDSPLELQKKIGLTNCSEEISAHTNLKNQQLHIGKDLDVASIDLLGDFRDYVRFKKVEHSLHKHYYFHLLKHQLLNGSQYHYTYSDEDDIKTVQVGSNGTTFSQLNFKFSSSNSVVSVQSSDGAHCLNYHFLSHQGERHYLTAVENPERPLIRYHYTTKDDGDYLKIAHKELPEGRNLYIEYYKPGVNIVPGIGTITLAKDDLRIGRVLLQNESVGTGVGLITTYRFVYHLHRPNETSLLHATEVFNANSQKTTYYYNKNHHLTLLEKFTGNTVQGFQQYCCEEYLWGDENSSDETNLLGKYFVKDSAVHAATVFDYDAVGNVQKLYFYGNLSGTAATPTKTNSKHPLGGECYTIQYRYSPANYLLLEEREQNGNGFIYSYVPGTNLLSATYVMDGPHIRIRQFFEYNSHGVVTKEIIDDGITFEKENLSGITERKIKNIHPSTQGIIGLPLVVEEKYLDLNTHEEKLLHRIESTFDSRGNLLTETQCDKNGEQKYTLVFSYDAHNNLVLKTNPLGHPTHYSYDGNDNLIREQTLYLDTHFIYDRANHLIAKKEQHSDATFSTMYEYDPVGNCTREIDPFFNSTYYSYDEFNRVIREQKGHNISQLEYDIVDNPIREINPNGFATIKTYNARNQVTSIKYPDGSHEQFIYNLDGTLLKHIALNGTETTYTYDYLGRIIKEVNGDRIVKNIYNAFHLLKSIDPEGTETIYHYNHSGELIEETTAQKKTTFTYDALGRLESTFEWINDAKALVKTLTYDNLDRIIEEKVTNTQGEIVTSVAYEYDPQGNRTKVITDKGVSATFYNSHQMPIKQIDALGNTTHIDYNYSFTNENGEFVLQTTHTDPLGAQTITTYDIHSQIAEIQKKNSLNQLLANQQFKYDPSGNRIEMSNSIVIDHTIVSEQAIKWEYTSMNKMASQIEAAGSKEQKITRYIYNNYGQKAAHVKPDGTKISYEYDLYGRLSRFFGTNFDYQYLYNKNHLPTEIKDLKTNTSTYRTYDALGSITEEILGNGLHSSYVYDPLSRVTQLILPDQTTIDYTYNEAHLKTITRHGYTHSYDEFDTTGLLLKSTLPNRETISYAYDVLNRPQFITSNHFQQTDFTYDKKGNLLKDSLNKIKRAFSYNELYHLTSENDHIYKTDSLANRLTKDNASYQINALNQLLNDSACTYAYDRNGNLSQKKQGSVVTHYSYDDLDRLVAVEKNHEKTTYSYDAFNRRLTKNSTLYLYHGQNEIGAVVDNEIVELRLLGIGRGAEIGAAVAIELNHSVYIPIHDHQGNVVTLQDMAGNIVENYHFTAFGEEEQTSHINPWRYYSKRHDEETGFVYFGRRYYAPDIGRWITADPIGFDDGPNLYAYLQHSPMMLFDLYGLWTTKDFGLTRSPFKDNNRGSFVDRVSSFFSPNSHIPFKDRDSKISRSSKERTPIRDRTSKTREAYDDDWTEKELIKNIREYHSGVMSGSAFLATSAISEILLSARTIGFFGKWAMQYGSRITAGKYPGQQTVQSVRSSWNNFNFLNSSKMKSPLQEHVLTRSKIRNYLENAGSLSKKQIVSDLESIGLKLKGKSPCEKFMEYQDKIGNIRVKIHPPDKITPYNHLHIYNKYGNSLNKNLDIVQKNSLEAHIPYGWIK